ncbi:MAG: glycerophosphodiester phosphodiesterase [Kiritimatiellia bacterium]
MKSGLALGVCALVAAVSAGPREDGLFISHVHRGGGRLERPDNTLETFLWCWGNGSAPECDCRKTKDGVGIMLHDNSLARTARGISPELAAKKVSEELSWADIRDVDVGSYLDPRYASQRIPTMQAVMAAMKGRPSCLLFVDEKGAGPALIAAEARRFGVVDQVYYTGCSYPNIVAWNALVPGGKSLLWIGKFPKCADRFDPVKRKRMEVDVQAHFERQMDELRRNGFKYVTAVSLHTYWNPRDPVDPFIIGTGYLKRIIDEFHAHGVKVCSIPFEGGDREEVYRRLWELGCDGFSTDYPSVMFKVIRELKAAAK